MNFTFGVLTYNSEKFVNETLASIKYQVITYGKGINISLIISDDSSCDHTFEVVQKWVSNNKDIFQDVIILKNERNQGTVANYNKLFQLIKTPYFHIIAGDDLYADTSIFEICKQLDSGVCISSFPISLSKDHKLFIEKHRLVRNIHSHLSEPINKGKMIKYIMYGSNVHTPSTLFLGEEYDQQVKDYVKKFRLFEDDPKWYKFAQKGVTYHFIFTPFIIYRYHDNSIAHRRGKTLTVFDEDKVKLINDYLKDDNCSLLMKVYLCSEKNKIAKKRHVSLYEVWRELNYLFYYIVELASGKYESYYKFLEKDLKKNRNYYRNLTNNL